MEAFPLTGIPGVLAVCEAIIKSVSVVTLTVLTNGAPESISDCVTV